jgi:hypothetical protein
LIGKRTIQWEGSVKFFDQKNGLECELTFPEKGMFGLERGLTHDMLTGSILQDGKEICEVDGSWLSHLGFNGKNYWTLENSDIIFPLRPEISLPSDCRYREDACALADGDLDHAQYEKERLEVLQRSDKKLRTEGYKS